MMNDDSIIETAAPPRSAQKSRGGGGDKGGDPLVAPPPQMRSPSEGVRAVAADDALLDCVEPQEDVDEGELEEI